MKTIIKHLVEIPGPSGFESLVRDAIRAEVAPLVDEVWLDNLGNLFARVGAPEGPKLMLSTPIDEPGLMASHVDDGGFVRFVPLGHVDPASCAGRRVRFLNGAAGVIGLEQKNSGATPTLDQMVVDLGSSDAETGRAQIGEVGVFQSEFLDLDGRLVSKALDGRAGAAVLIETTRRLKDSGAVLAHPVVFVFSVQSQVGARGALVAAFGLEPDLAVTVSLTEADDLPRSTRPAVSLGRGPAIKVRDGAMLSDSRWVRRIEETCERLGLHYQVEVRDRGGAETQSIALSRGGVPTGGISIPCRYRYSPSEMIDLGDLENAVQLLVELAQSPLVLD